MPIDKQPSNTSSLAFSSSQAFGRVSLVCLVTSRHGANRCCPSSLVHRSVIIQTQPALDDTVNNPDKVRQKHKPTHDYQRSDGAQHTPQQAKPEGANLPAKVTFQERSSNVAFFT